MVEDTQNVLQDSCDTFEYASVQFWDSKEMQIVESKDDQVTPTTPFVLPNRWTFATLKDCVEDYINRRCSGDKQRVKQLYYKSSQGKSAVCLHSDSDVSTLLDEYHLRYPTGRKRSGRCIMYLTIDLEDEGMPTFLNFIAC